MVCISTHESELALFAVGPRASEDDLCKRTDLPCIFNLKVMTQAAQLGIGTFLVNSSMASIDSWYVIDGRFCY